MNPKTYDRPSPDAQAKFRALVTPIIDGSIKV